MNTNQVKEYRPWRFFLYVLILSIPGYLLGGRRLPIPVNLPASSVVIFVPLIAASYLMYRQYGAKGVRDLLRKALDYKKINNKIWYLPIFLLTPLIYFFAYVVMRLIGKPLPDPNTPILLAPAFFILFFIAAIFEELGWMGYAIDPLQDRWGALKAAIIVGLAWQLWHLIPDIQLNYTASFIFWHDIQGVALRILMVWIYNNTGKSVFSSILVHAMDNLSWIFFPDYVSAFDPFYTAIFACLAAFIVIILWDEKTLSRLRRLKRSPV